MMPNNTELVPEVQQFRTTNGTREAGELLWTDERVLSNIGLIIFATG